MRTRMTISELWSSRDSQPWDHALLRYWDFVKPANLELEHRLESLNPEWIRNLDERGWYEFLHDEYFRWKYTAPSRYATTTRSLERYVEGGRLDDLYRIKERLLALDRRDIGLGLLVAREILGLGTAGASGLLALLYPETFATVDQFAAKALCEVPGLPEAAALAKMNPLELDLEDGALLIRIMQRKAVENNQWFGTLSWTPRKIDKVLWTYGRK